MSGFQRDNKRGTAQLERTAQIRQRMLFEVQKLHAGTCKVRPALRPLVSAPLSAAAAAAAEQVGKKWSHREELKLVKQLLQLG